MNDDFGDHVLLPDASAHEQENGQQQAGTDPSDVQARLYK